MRGFPTSSCARSGPGCRVARRRPHLHSGCANCWAGKVPRTPLAESAVTAGAEPSARRRATSARPWSWFVRHRGKHRMWGVGGPWLHCCWCWVLGPSGTYQRANEPPVATFAPPPHSVAVLAFANMSGDAKDEYFSDGLSEELLNTLVRIDKLQVAARTSSFSFKGTRRGYPDGRPQTQCRCSA